MTASTKKNKKPGTPKSAGRAAPRGGGADRPAFERRSTKAIAACVLASIALTAADLGSKSWAHETLSRERTGEPPPVCEPDEDGYTLMQRLKAPPVVLVENRFELRYAENCGAAFGLMRSAEPNVRRAVFGLAAVLAVGVLMWMFAMGRGGQPFAYSVPFIVSGAVGNLADRVRLGYVVDFIRFYVPEWEFEYPTFNVADITITIGVVLLLIDGLLEGRREREADAKRAAATKEEPDEAEPEPDEAEPEPDEAEPEPDEAEPEPDEAEQPEPDDAEPDAEAAADDDEEDPEPDDEEDPEPDDEEDPEPDDEDDEDDDEGDEPDDEDR